MTATAAATRARSVTTSTTTYIADTTKYLARTLPANHLVTIAATALRATERNDLEAK